MVNSRAYTIFTHQFLEANDWQSRKDGCPVELLDALTENEKQLAEAELLKRLKLGDDWPVRGLGHIKSKAALPELKRLLKKAKGAMRACLALAIWKISGDESMCDIVIKESHKRYTDNDNSTKTFEMIDIIFFLAEFPNDSARNRLAELKDSKNYLISYNAQRAPEYWRQYTNE